MDVMPWDRDPNWKRNMSKAYLALHEKVSAALYEEDPEGFGATIESPRDEYDTEAARLIAAIRAMDGDVGGAAHSMFKGSTDRLVSRVSRAWQSYEASKQ